MEYIQSIYINDIIVSEEEKNVPFNILSLSRHNAYEIYILLQGERIVYVDGKTYTTVAGDAVLIKSNVDHRSEGITPYKGICLQFTEEVLNEYFTSKAKYKMLECFKTCVVSLDKDALREILMYFYKINDEVDYKFMHITSVFAVLNKCTENHDDLPQEINKVSLKNITNFLDSNYITIDGLDYIAAHFGITKEYLCSLFKKQTGMTIVTYLNNIRVQEACRLLTKTDRSVEQISMDCGFASLIYFHRLFKKIMGHSPGQYRKLVAKYKIKSK